MWFLANEAGSSGWDGIIGLIAIAVIILFVYGCKLAWKGILSFVYWLLPYNWKPSRNDDRFERY